MTTDIPRLLFAAPDSGSGKTTVVCGLLQALREAGERPAAFKCGPDYIDPLFHTEILGTPSRNLDLFFTDENTTRALFCSAAQGHTLAVMEGVMGYYDGVADEDTASSYHLAAVTKTPVILVIPAKGMTRTKAAMLRGLLSYRADNNIRAFLLNGCSSAQYALLAPMLTQALGLSAAGYLPQDPAYALESRHLGLVTATEVIRLKEKMALLAASLRETVDLRLLRSIAKSAPPLCYSALPIAPVTAQKPVLAIARDRAFCFYYEDNFALFSALGAELAFFSPLSDTALPAGTDAVYLGGGYPELYGTALSANQALHAQLRAKINAGMPAIAECGGFLYLQQAMRQGDTRYPMAGVLPGQWQMTNRLQRPFGYIALTANEDTVLCKKGAQIRAHVFHYSESETEGDAFTAQKPGREEKIPCLVRHKNLIAGYPHFYFHSNRAFARQFLCAAASYKEGKLHGNTV